ncbi:MAG TPA: DciA family protein [Roseiarcus sp.]|nr:DciA family protein [Roseiarcus sp.]
MTKPARDKARSFAAQLGSLLKGVVEPTLAARGLGQTSLVTDWPDIVGAEIARYARPIQIQWPPRGARRAPDETAPATLVLRVDGAFALEAQHAAAIIVERVNAHLGWRCIERIAFRQGPLAELKSKRRAPPAPSASAQAQASALAEPIDDEELRRALTKLGARAIDRAARRR